MMWTIHAILAYIVGTAVSKRKIEVQGVIPAKLLTKQVDLMEQSHSTEEQEQAVQEAGNGDSNDQGESGDADQNGETAEAGEEEKDEEKDEDKNEEKDPEEGEVEGEEEDGPKDD